jgi:membrane-bound serine protease (ClpP class)
MMVLSIVFVYPSWEQAVISLIIAVVGAVLLLLLSIRILPTRAAWQRLVLKTDIDTAGGYVAPKADLKELVGKQGIALTPLRPAGSAQIEGQRVDVVTEGDFIEKGSSIKVVKVEGWRVIVERM